MFVLCALLNTKKKLQTFRSLRLDFHQCTNKTKLTYTHEHIVFLLKYLVLSSHELIINY